MNLLNRNIYIIGALATAGISFASCSEEAEFATGGSGSEVMLSVQMKPQSENAAFAEGSKVSVLANDKVYSYTLAAGGSMSPLGEPLTWNGTDFEIKAWTPVVQQSVSLTDQTTADKLAACDLMAAAGNVTSRYAYLTFDHQMTCVSWSFRAIDPSYTQQQINEAKVYLLGYGSVNFTNGIVASVGNPDSRIATFEAEGADSRQGTAILAPADMWNRPLIRIVIGGDEYVYSPDQNNSADAASAAGELVAGKWQKYRISITRKMLSVEMESTDVAWGNIHNFASDDITDAKLVATIDASVSNKPGYTVSGLDNGFVADRDKGFTVTYTESAFGGLTWTGNCKVTRTETAVAGNATATTHTYTFSDIKSDISIGYLSEVEVGDYYYDNGAWGKDESREGCKTVGRVFHVGLNANDDSSYGLCKVRGYVVPMTVGTTAPLKWFINQADDKYLQALSNIPVSSDVAVRESYYGGYRLTGLLDSDLAPYRSEWAGQIPFWAAYKNFGMAAPVMSSGWYIPTYAQLKDVCASQVYDKFSGLYWSSQVYPGTGNAEVGGVEDGEKNTMWAIRCADNQTAGYGWAIDEAKLLPILTF